MSHERLFVVQHGFSHEGFSFFLLFHNQLDLILTKNIVTFITFVNRAQIICDNVLINYFGIKNNKNVNGRIMFDVVAEHLLLYQWNRVYFVWRKPMDFTSIRIVSR